MDPYKMLQLKHPLKSNDYKLSVPLMNRSVKPRERKIYLAMLRELHAERAFFALGAGSLLSREAADSELHALEENCAYFQSGRLGSRRMALVAGFDYGNPFRPRNDTLYSIQKCFPVSVHFCEFITEHREADLLVVHA